MERAPKLQAACRELLPGYAGARREHERWAVLTRACLSRSPVERSGEPAPPVAERFDEIALSLMLDPEADSVTLLVTEVGRASDLLCALWLARRSGLFVPGATRGLVGARSRIELVPCFQPGFVGHAAVTLATLYANAAYKRHLAARGNAQRVLLDAGEAAMHERLKRQARSWGVKLAALSSSGRTSVSLGL